MKDKRGFIRILEAVIAIIIVFVYVINILPQLPKPTGKIPPELDNTLNAILKEVQNNPQFRDQVIIARNEVPIRDKIISYLPPFSPWKFAFKVCTANTNDCNYFFPNDQNPPTSVAFTNPPDDFANRIVGTATAVYTKAAFLSKKDPNGPGIPTGSCPGNRRGCCGPTGPIACTTGNECCENQVISLYMWSNV